MKDSAQLLIEAYTSITETEVKKGFCNSDKMPIDLARKAIAACIEVHYYAARTEGATSDDAIEFAVDTNVLLTTLDGIFCDALPQNISELIQHVVSRHPIKNGEVYSDQSDAETKWDDAKERFQSIESQIEEFSSRHSS